MRLILVYIGLTVIAIALLLGDLAVCVDSINIKGISDNKATCFDGAKNGEETDVDCGGQTCSACSDGRACNKNSDCFSQVCKNGICQASSDPSITNQPSNSAMFLRQKLPSGISGIGGIKNSRVFM